MWISRTAFENLVEARAEAVGRAHAMDLQVQSQKATMDWMAMRLTQSEHERAQLIHNYTGVKITVPSIEQVGIVENGQPSPAPARRGRRRRDRRPRARPAPAASPHPARRARG